MFKKQFSAKTIPFAFFLIAFLSYGILIPWTGFYWDDWPFAWIAKFLGPAAFIPAFRGFRPFLGPIFFFTTSLIPANPMLWQIFALIIRFVAGLSAWFALNQVWPNHKRQTLTITCLMIVFPGYSQNWVALTHINQEWIPFIFYLLSIGLSIRAIRNSNASLPNTILALLFLVIGLFPTEYFFGMEPLRFLFIWMVITESAKGFRPRLIRVLKYWWPYLLIWLADAAWLAYYYKSGAYISYGIAASQQLPNIKDAFLAIVDVLWKAGFYAWFQILVLSFHSIAAPTTLGSLALIAVCFSLLIFYFSKLESFSSVHADSIAFAIPAILIGLIGILLGRVPSFAAGLPLTLQSSYDRFMISMMLGGSLFIVGVIELWIKNERAKLFAFAFLIALGIGQQFFNANIFRRDWQRQQDIYWQMAWRIPALQPDTAILTDFVPIDYETDLSFTAPINWIYAPEVKPPDLPYAMIYVNKRLGGGSLSDLKPDTAIQLPYRTLTFRGNTSQSIAIYAPQNGCLRVFDPSFDDAETYSKFPDSLKSLVSFSDPSRIITSAPKPSLPSPPFTSEPSHTWCYFYEKAELARQSRDWNQIVELGNQAKQQGFSTQDPFEWLPFIEAYARAGDANLAKQLTQQAWNEQPRIRAGLCQLWKRVQANGPNEAQSFASHLLTALGCNQ
jgi:hypothetical protein